MRGARSLPLAAGVLSNLRLAEKRLTPRIAFALSTIRSGG